MRTRIEHALSGLDRWFDSIRVDWPTPGYGGPVVHWWRNQLAYRGSGIDWRYEGIVAGYLELWNADEDYRWLDKARRAGEDILASQLPGGHFQNSRFELNPGEAGTPHEAAVDIALFRLATAFGERDPILGARCREAAVLNLGTAFYDRLWDPVTATLKDSPSGDTFVPNKAATFIEAVLWHAEECGDLQLIERYAIPTARRILSMQVGRKDSELFGAIAQNRLGRKTVHAYFPLYVARCVPPMLDLARLTGDMRLRDSALDAAAFLDRCRLADGSFPQVLYPKRRRVDSPRWIAGTGEMLRAFLSANQNGASISLTPTLEWMLRGARKDGRFATAVGFGSVLPFISRGNSELDELGVTGWCDKAFRSLASIYFNDDSKPRAQNRTAETVQAFEVSI